MHLALWMASQNKTYMIHIQLIPSIERENLICQRLNALISSFAVKTLRLVTILSTPFTNYRSL